MSPVNSMFVCIIKKKIIIIIGKSVLKMADIGKMLNIGADNRSTPSSYQKNPEAHFPGWHHNNFNFRIQILMDEMAFTIANQSANDVDEIEFQTDGKTLVKFRRLL